MAPTLVDDRYACGDLLGSGGMADVYLAHDELLDRDVALKVLNDRYAKDEEFVKRFRREARSVARLNHPNIIPVYTWGRSEDGTYYMVMEYLPGGTLKDLILAGGPLDPYVAAELGIQVGCALGHAHERGVIHRDVKSRNVLLTRTGDAKVTDFGIAWAATATTTTSRSGLFSGTAGYISPEQAKGKPGDPRSDLYSLGVVLYEMLTGDLPYRGEDPLSVVLKHVNEPPRSPREANPNVPEPLDTITTKLLAKDPEDRYASAFALAKDLERASNDLPPLAVGTEKTAVEGPAGPSRPIEAFGEERREVAAILPTIGASMEVFGGGRRLRGKVLLATAMLLLGVILLGSLTWAAMQY